MEYFLYYDYLDKWIRIDDYNEAKFESDKSNASNFKSMKLVMDYIQSNATLRDLWDNELICIQSTELNPL
jgi:hypothetical protein